jgi:hypothetical protein
MRRFVSAALTASALALALVGPVVAAPAAQANCAADFVTAVAPGSLGALASADARALGGIGHQVGGQGSGEAPTDCGQR